MSALSDFIVNEKKQYANRYANLFASSLIEALRYYEFLLIVTDRYKKRSKKMISLSNNEVKLSPTQTGGPFPVTNEKIRLMEEWSRLNTLVHLEIESFYLFAKIFLDKIALFIQNYFGQARGISLRSHDKWTKNHDEFRLVKRLTYPRNLYKSIVFLNKCIVNYRDKQITHLHSQRTMRATTWGRAKNMKIAAYHSETKEQSYSEELPELMQVIDEYIQQLITLIESNRAKTRLELRKTSGCYPS